MTKYKDQMKMVREHVSALNRATLALMKGMAESPTDAETRHVVEHIGTELGALQDQCRAFDLVVTQLHEDVLNEVANG